MPNIFYKKDLIGTHITSFSDGTSPVTDQDGAIQVLTLKHPKGTELAGHMHTPTERKTSSLQEAIVVKKGSITLDLYAPDKTLFKHLKMTEGEAFILLSGGLGVHMDEDAELFEFKNGPFVEDKELI
jgi:hypothetical protein